MQIIDLFFAKKRNLFIVFNWGKLMSSCQHSIINNTKIVSLYQAKIMLELFSHSLNKLNLNFENDLSLWSCIHTTLQKLCYQIRVKVFNNSSELLYVCFTEKQLVCIFNSTIWIFNVFIMKVLASYELNLSFFFNFSAFVFKHN